MVIKPRKKTFTDNGYFFINYTGKAFACISVYWTLIDVWTLYYSMGRKLSNFEATFDQRESERFESELFTTAWAGLSCFEAERILMRIDEVRVWTLYKGMGRKLSHFEAVQVLIKENQKDVLAYAF